MAHYAWGGGWDRVRADRCCVCVQWLGLLCSGWGCGATAEAAVYRTRARVCVCAGLRSVYGGMLEMREMRELLELLQLLEPVELRELRELRELWELWELQELWGLQEPLASLEPPERCGWLEWAR